ncbi:DNA primase, large subunit family [Actinidia rufa]|uniref:DNA primase, large subunit family n=1 Tax=Actinidia rufa TaxID=165716 RepID=A0A7J0FFE6_9ERIC|nr:DNA primase, large subunit family [Actinidia rufa]
MEAFEKLDRERGYGYDRGMEEEDQAWYDRVSIAFRKWTSTIKEREKDRLTPIVEALSISYLGPGYSQPREFADIFLKYIDQAAKSSFPLCYLRHLFDKVAAERFDKEYAYSIRHNYGKEGRENGIALLSAVLSSLENLRAAIGNRAMEEVIDKVQALSGQKIVFGVLACTLTFEAVHGSSCDAGINHPNQYFIDSQKILQRILPDAFARALPLSRVCVLQWKSVQEGSLSLLMIPRPKEMKNLGLVMVERALSHVEMKNKEAAYQAWLGYYNSSKVVGRDKYKLVELANEFNRSKGATLQQIPKLVLG